MKNKKKLISIIFICIGLSAAWIFHLNNKGYEITNSDIATYKSGEIIKKEEIEKVNSIENINVGDQLIYYNGTDINISKVVQVGSGTIKCENGQYTYGDSTFNVDNCIEGSLGKEEILLYGEELEGFLITNFNQVIGVVN